MRIRTFVVTLLLLAITTAVVFILRPNRVILELPLEAGAYRFPVWGAILGAFACGTLIALVIQVSGLGRSAIRRARTMLSARRREAMTRAIEKGRRAEREQRHDEALAAYNEANRIAGGSFTAQMRLGDLLARLGRLREAIAAHEEAQRLDPTSEEPAYALALEWLDLGELDRARNQLVSLIEASPKSAVGPLRRLRELEIRAGDWPAAGDAARRLLAIAPRSNPEADQDAIQALGIRTEIARQRAESGEERAAIGMVRKLVREAPGYVPARILLAHISRGEDAPAARESLLEGFRLTGETALLEALVDSDLEAERPEEAIATLRGLAATREHEPSVRLALGRLYLRLEMIDEAAEQFADLYETFEAAPLFATLLARVEERRGNTSRAAELYREVFDAPRWRPHEARCTACGEAHAGWEHRCGNCGAYGRLSTSPEALLGSDPSR